MFLAIGCSNVATGGRGVQRGADVEGGGGQQWSGGQLMGGGATVGVFSTSKNRPSHRNYKCQNSLSWNRAEKLWGLLMPAGRYFYPVFEDEKSKASDEKSLKRKISLEKTDRTYVFPTTSFEST